MKDSLYRACMAQIQTLLAAKPRCADAPTGPDAPNYALMMRVRR